MYQFWIYLYLIWLLNLYVYEWLKDANKDKRAGNTIKQHSQLKSNTCTSVYHGFKWLLRCEQSDSYRLKASPLHGGRK